MFIPDSRVAELRSSLNMTQNLSRILVGILDEKTDGHQSQKINNNSAHVRKETDDRRIIQEGCS